MTNEAHALDGLIVEVGLVRDADEPDAPALRVAYLDRVCSLGQLVLRRDAWPIAALGASVLSDGRWLVRVESLSIDRDARMAGRSQSLHPSPDATTVRGFPLRLSLSMAVHKALLEHFAHETGELLSYCGERILDPHADDGEASDEGA